MLSFRKTLNLVIPYKNTYYFGLFKDVNVNPVARKQIKQQPKQQKGGLLSKIHFKSQDANTIDQINKYFQGIRVNTKYAKFYNQDSINKIYSSHEVRKITDLPFVHQQSVMSNMIIGSKVNRACQPILQKINKAELKQKILQMSTGFFTDIFEKKRTVKIQPNFEREARKVINSLTKSSYQFNLVKNQKVKVQIKGSELIRGVEVTRNNNYSIDSYQIVKQNQYTFYRLWQKGTYKIPEQQWRTQNNIILRINAKISSPYQIKITQGTNTIVSNNHHFFVFEMDLKHPPRFCQFNTPQKQYLSKYRPVLDNLTITNVDQRNRFAAYVYEEKEKKEKLINKIV